MNHLRDLFVATMTQPPGARLEALRVRQEYEEGLRNDPNRTQTLRTPDGLIVSPPGCPITPEQHKALTDHMSVGQSIVIVQEPPRPGWRFW